MVFPLHHLGGSDYLRSIKKNGMLVEKMIGGGKKRVFDELVVAWLAVLAPLENP